MNEPTLLAAAGIGLITLGALNILAFLIIRDMRRTIKYLSKTVNSSLRLHAGLSEEIKKLNKANGRQQNSGGFKRNRFTDRGEGGR